MKDLGYKGINITGQVSKFPIETLYDTLIHYVQVCYDTWSLYMAASASHQNQFWFLNNAYMT